MGDLNVCLQTQQVVRIETVVLVEMILQFITKPQLDTLDEEVHPIAVVVISGELLFVGLRIANAPSQTITRFSRVGLSGAKLIKFSPVISLWNILPFVKSLLHRKLNF